MVAQANIEQNDSNIANKVRQSYFWKNQARNRGCGSIYAK